MSTSSRVGADQRIVDCEKCGGSQIEPRRVISTQCNDCGNHLTPGASEPKESILPWKRKGAQGQLSKDPKEAAARLASIASGQPLPGSESASSKKGSSRKMRCPMCSSVHSLPNMSKSTMCPSCGEPLDLSDHLIEDCANFTIRTVGNVTIQPTGVLQSTEIFCHDLTVNGGKIMGKIQCTGDFHFTGNTTILGSIVCRHLTITEGSSLATVQPVACYSADILGTCEATIDAIGKVAVGPKGMLRGDCIAGGLAISTGGILQGASRTRPKGE